VKKIRNGNSGYFKNSWKRKLLKLTYPMRLIPKELNSNVLTKQGSSFSTNTCILLILENLKILLALVGSNLISNYSELAGD